MKINIDEIKESLQKTKNYIATDLSEEEEKEINIFIEQLVSNLQKKVEKINIKNLSESIKQYIEENDNV